MLKSLSSQGNWLASICCAFALDSGGLWAGPIAQTQEPPAVSVKVVEEGDAVERAADLRRVVVGPGVNEPDPFPGFGGSVAWAGVVRLKDGALLAAFNAGYWHVSPPTPSVMTEAKVEAYRKMGMPREVAAPTGGRIMFVRSEDQGKTWSKPQTLADTPADDRQAGLLVLPNGTVLASFFTSFGDVDPAGDPAWFSHTLIVRSFDGGRTWEKHPRPIQPQSGSPFTGEAADGPAVLRKDGSILLTSYGCLRAGGNNKHTALGIYASKNRGRTWKLLSIVKADHNLEEAHAVELPDGRLVMIARPEGELWWSHDGGHTWTPPAKFGMRMYAPTLYVLPDGTLVCLHGSYAPGFGGLRAIFSTDGGETWIAPAKDHGFLVDADAYGYGAGVLLPDGSLYVIYQRTGSHRTADAKTNSLLTLRLRVRSDHSGIDLLPSVADMDQRGSLRTEKH
ncbi:MAG TPA: sialidase family protein [Candidatus Saccharimonadales bacterium]|nr:sialidase family protein [Candidatus Saccharimonadales bacterium]